MLLIINLAVLLLADGGRVDDEDDDDEEDDEDERKLSEEEFYDAESNQSWSIADGNGDAARASSPLSKLDFSTCSYFTSFR